MGIPLRKLSSHLGGLLLEGRDGSFVEALLRLQLLGNFVQLAQLLGSVLLQALDLVVLSRYLLYKLLIGRGLEALDLVFLLLQLGLQIGNLGFALQRRFNVLLDACLGVFQLTDGLLLLLSKLLQLKFQRSRFLGCFGYLVLGVIVFFLGCLELVRLLGKILLQ